MPWLHEFLKFVSRSNRRSRATIGIRALATVLSAILVFGSLAPSIAFAGEADSEQEGAAPPGALPGLEEGPELEPGGEESVLEQLPGSLPSGEGEEEAPLEPEPAQEPEPPPPPVPAPPAATEAAPPAEAPPSPEYGPSYETAPAPSSEPVEGDTLAAPPPNPPSGSPDKKAEGAAQPATEAPAPAAPTEEAPAPAPEAPPPATVPKQPSDVPGGLSGRAVHTVHGGECLWSIAAALLPAGADNAEIAAEVQRLWKLNAGRIGTGDPSLIYAGTELRLR